MAAPLKMSDDKLRDFVLAYCDGRVFTNRHVRRPQDVLLVFLPLLLCRNRGVLDDVALVWEYMDQALPRALNGMPQFASARFMGREDWARASAAIRKEMGRRKAIVV